MGGAKKALERGVRNVVRNPIKAATFGVAAPMASAGQVLLGMAGEEPKKRRAAAPKAAKTIEERSGIKAPEFRGITDESGRQLLPEFMYDPTKSAAFRRLQEQAMAQPGESPWAKMQTERQALEQAQAADIAGRQQAQALAQAQSGLARMGGLSAGARERMALEGQRGLARAQQDVARQGMLSRLGITESDIARQQQALSGVGTTELQGQAQNLQALLGDVGSRRQFEAERYGQQMAAYGAEQTARGQEKAAKSARKK